MKIANTIAPLFKPLIVTGRLVYNEAMRACSIIRFKKRFVQEFSQLQSHQDWNYRVEYWHSSNKTTKRIHDAQVRGEGVPLLLFIYPAEEADYEQNRKITCTSCKNVTRP